MSFDMNTLTLKGAELLAASTVQNRLILDGCDAAVGFIDQNTAVNISARPSSPLSTTTDVSIIGSTAEHVMARAQWTEGQQTGGNANTLYLYGHNEQSPSNIYVIYICSSQSTFHLPTVGDVTPVFEALFDMIYACTLNSVTTASTSVYATLAEFNTLKERTVTTHKEQQATVGENQTIYGDKTFKGALVGNTILPETPSGNLGASNHRFASVYSTASDFTSLTCPTINLDSAGKLRIKDNVVGISHEMLLSVKPYNTDSLYDTYLNMECYDHLGSAGSIIEAMCDDGTGEGFTRLKMSSHPSGTSAYFETEMPTSTGEIRLDGSSTATTIHLKASDINSDSNNSFVVKSGSEISLYVNYDSQYIEGDTQIRLVSGGIGISTKKSSGYSIGLTTNQLNINAASITAETDEATNIGSSIKKFGDAYFKSVHGSNIYGGGDIGASASKFTNVYAKNLYGKIPTPSITGSGSNPYSETFTEPEVGGIVMIYFEVDYSSAPVGTRGISVGRELRTSASVVDDLGTSATVSVLKIAEVISGAITGGSFNLTGTCKLLCCSQLSAATGSSTTRFKGTGLAMCVETVL